MTFACRFLPCLFMSDLIELRHWPSAAVLFEIKLKMSQSHTHEMTCSIIVSLPHLNFVNRRTTNAPTVNLISSGLSVPVCSSKLCDTPAAESSILCPCLSSA